VRDSPTVHGLGHAEGSTRKHALVALLQLVQEVDPGRSPGQVVELPSVEMLAESGDPDLIGQLLRLHSTRSECDDISPIWIVGGSAAEIVGLAVLENGMPG
jgi:hypothetical protein